ncbi:nucleoid-associated protein [Ostreibacterium oceani]|uniref:Nucleoid-associated protein n=1 Tax=Ostreibacterium oceani TaxID=2654998 RepID=A0A6N7F4T2_9GAMM|nr:nucleoid-associated protein [Ostreibacterium oceani]MPV86896.1 hypothetical protein [Ostreibacterium oceani]
MKNNDINILASIIHKIDKKAHSTNEVDPTLRENLHEQTEALTKLFKLLDDSFRKGKKHSFCKSFNEENTVSYWVKEKIFNNPTQTISKTDECNKRNVDVKSVYLDLSKRITSALHYHLYKQQASTGGNVPIIFYTKGDNLFLIIALVKSTEKIDIDENGHVIDVTTIDDETIKFAARINLDEMRSHSNTKNASPNDQAETETPNAYIHWLQHNKDIVQTYAQDFIPIAEKLNSSKNTKALISVLNSFIEHHYSGTLEEQGEQLKDRVYKKLLEFTEAENSIHLIQDVDPIIDSFKPQGAEIPRFQAYREDTAIPIDDSFGPDKTSLRGAIKFNITLGEKKDIKVTALRKYLGRDVKILQTGDSYILSIALSGEERTKLIKEHPGISPNGSDTDKSGS